jgi:hypothetical protein
LVTEKSWFANEKALIGTAFLDHTDKDLNFVMMEPDADGSTVGWPAAGAWTSRKKRSMHC